MDFKKTGWVEMGGQCHCGQERERWHSVIRLICPCLLVHDF